MGVEKLPVIVRELLRHGRSEKTPVALIERGTLPGQKIQTGTLADICGKSGGIRAPALIVVGEVVRLGAILGAETIQAVTLSR